MAQRTSRDATNVHHQNGQRDGTARCHVQFCQDPAKSIAPFGQAERSFNLDSVGIVNVFGLLICQGVFLRSAQRRTGKANAVQFAERQVLSITINLVRKCPLGIMSRPFAVAFNCSDQYIGFAVCVKGKLLYSVSLPYYKI